MRIFRTPDSIRYAITRRYPDGSVGDYGVLTTKRTRGVGEYVNLPDGPTPEPLLERMERARLGIRTRGHIWRVVATEEPDVLLVEYVRPYGPSG